MNVTVLRVEVIFFLCTIKFQNATSQSCPQSENDGLPSFANYGQGVDRITLEHQAIITSYRFVCNQMCGNITEWGVDVELGKHNDNGLYIITFQVWRPSPAVDVTSGTGCYSLVGSNRFSQIHLSDSVVEVTPSPQDYIMFRPGDVLGLYVEEARTEQNGVVVLTSPSSFTSEIVWYASIAPSMATSQNGDCPYSVGSSGLLNTLTQAAPVISISSSTFSCPPLPASTTLPTPPPQLTTDRQATLPPTAQEPTTERLLDPLTTITSRNDGNGETQSGLLVTTTGAWLGEPTTSEAVTESPSFIASSGINVGAVAGGIIGVVLVMILTLVVVTIISVAGRKKKCYITSSPTTPNEAYGINVTYTCGRESANDYATVVDLDTTIIVKQNECSESYKGKKLYKINSNSGILIHS